MKTILIVDDQMEVCELVDVTLSADDVRIIKASKGDEAIEIAQREKPDLIIMDIMMPGKINGIEATRILKSDKSTRHISILMLTAKGQDRDLEEGFKAGADAYFIKPFSPLELIRKVEEVFES
ncbi:MAG TPA: response regulator [Candidatus Aminicenantes bacterium]|nr:response regulator [Candidatus Aminicenantes bacterium]